MKKEKENLPDGEKLKKKIHRASNSIFALGVFGILINLSVYVWMLVDNKSYVELGLPLMDTTGIIINIILLLLWVILGKKIESLKFLQTGKYIISSIIISFIILAFTLLTGGRVGILLFFVIGYLFSALSAFNKLIKKDSFKKTLIKDALFNTKNTIIAVLTSIILLFGAILVDSYIFYPEEVISTKKETIFEDEILEINKILPMMIDDETQLDSISINNNIISYKYSIINNKLSDIDIVYFKNYMNKEVIIKSCNSSDVKSILDNGKNIKYSYFSSDGKLIASFDLNNDICN